MRALRNVALVLVVLGAVAGCGGDDDQQPQEQRAAAPDADTQIAQRLERYLEANVRVKGSVSESLSIVDVVQVNDGQAKVYAMLNSFVPADRKPARVVCRAIGAAKVPGVKSAVVVDAGDTELLRC